jgi:hypothetical protein
MEYHLEIYAPGSARDVWISFEADSPFMAMSAGDIVNPGLWEGSESPMKVLRVVTVEHLVWLAGGTPKQKVMVFTEEAEGTDELRTGQTAA